MNRCTAALAVLALALGGCATYGPGSDGSYAGAYNGGYYTAGAAGYGDYYYDRPQVVFNGYPDSFYGYGGYGFGYGPWGFGYDPWFYRPWWGYGYHRWWGDPDGDGDRDVWRHHHLSGQAPWPRAAPPGQVPRGGMARGEPTRGEPNRRPQPRWTPRPKP